MTSNSWRRTAFLCLFALRAGPAMHALIGIEAQRQVAAAFDHGEFAASATTRNRAATLSDSSSEPRPLEGPLIGVFHANK